MRYLLLILFFYLGGLSLQAQDRIVTENGTVSFVSSRKAYVKFASTKAIEVGDTLFRQQAAELIPALVVENKSSTSTVCVPLEGIEIKVKDVFLFRKRVKAEKKKPIEVSPPASEELAINNDPVVKPEEDQQEEEVLFKEKIKGRVSAASYSNIADVGNRHRMRYAFSFRGYNLNNSRFSTESYITFRHTLNDSTSLAEALKVYSLNVRYDFDANTRITLGRKINPNFSSMGAIDGLQFEKGWGKFSAGAIAGTRPDFRDYSFNAQLLQFGAYLSYGSNRTGQFAQTTLGVIEQMNAGNTDRRFIYLQHSSTPVKNLSFFGSMEVDLFEKVNEQVNNRVQLTNLYATLRYRIGRRFRIFAAYDTRKNIIYYESYKNFIDQLIEDETRQGLRLGFSHRILKKLSWGANANVRFQQSQRNPSRNASGYITYSQVPFIKARVNLRASFLQTDYLQSQIFGIRLSKELIKGKVDADIYYRWVDYNYLLGDRIVHQNIAGASLSIRLQKQLSLHLFYEGIQDLQKLDYHRVNVKLIKRF